MVNVRIGEVAAGLSKWSDLTAGLGRMLSTQYSRGSITPALLPGEGRDSFVAMVIEEHRKVEPPAKTRGRKYWKIDDYLREAGDNQVAAINDALDFIRSLRRTC